MPQPKFAPGPRGGAYTEADDFNMQIEHVNNEFFLDKWAGGGWTNISVHKTYADALAARNEIMKFLRSGAAEDVVTATDSRERPATIKESLTVHDCFGWAWEDAGGQWVFVKNSPGQEHAIACHAAALKEIKIDQPQARPTMSADDIHSCSEFCDRPECVAAREAQAQGEPTLPPLPEGKAVVRGPVSAFKEPEYGTLVDFDCEGPLSHCPADEEELFTADQVLAYGAECVQSHREAIAKRDAALKACVEAMRNAILSGEPANTWGMQDAIQQAEEARK